MTPTPTSFAAQRSGEEVSIGKQRSEAVRDRDGETGRERRVRAQRQRRLRPLVGRS